MPYCRTLRLGFLAFAAVLAAVPSWAANVNVTVGGSEASYQPATVTINVGDTVTWTNAGGTHDVHADDNSFFNATSGTAWTFSHTFTAAGTVGYHCTVHGAPGLGMFGTVIVQGSGGGGGPGTLRFSLAAYTAGEGAGSANVTVQRVNGDDGAVSVQFSAAAGTATAGQDFTAVTGTLSWGDKDSSSKSFTVPIVNDSAAEANETILLSLSNPTGGAVLDSSRQTATLTIQDNDGAPGPTPAAPTNLQAVAQSTTEVTLTWTDNSNNETGFQIERRTVDGTFQEVATVGPNGSGAVSAVVGGLAPSTFYLFRIRAVGNGAVVSAFSNEAGVTTLGDVAACASGPETLCLNNGRFKVQVVWRIPDGTTGTGKAVPIPSAPDSGLFFFFGPSNIELLIKVLNACVPQFNRYWVFFAATTNVEFVMVVTDTATGKTRGYFNPLNRPAPPVQDVDAFATCP
jgi:plastocyanin